MKRRFIRFEPNGSWFLVLDKPNLTDKEGACISNAFQNASLKAHPRSLLLGKSFFGEDFGEPFKKPLIDYNKHVKRDGAIQINKNGGWCGIFEDDILEEKIDTVYNVFK